MADLPALHEGSVLLKSQLRGCGVLRHKLSDHLSPTFSQLLRIGDGDRVVSIALHSAGMRLLSNLLFGINILNSFVLSVITILRLWAVSRSNGLYRAAIVHDLTQHVRGVTFLTTVAAVCGLGTQIAMMTEYTAAADALWVFAGFL